MNKIRLFILVLIPCSLLLTPSCSPEARWETDGVEISMKVITVSAGFAECSFSTNKDAYYLISIEPARVGYDPMQHQKQFMMLALDSANVAYLTWRNNLLKQGEFNIAPFSSHALQYGSVDHFFTGLLPDEDYWIYSFVVDPVKMTPVGSLNLATIHTTDSSIIDMHFAYRIKGWWDYIYPMDSTGHINTHFPYIATTEDSLSLVLEGTLTDPYYYFLSWTVWAFAFPDSVNVLYGVKATENDGWQSSSEFEKGHTYYTCIAGYDGLFEHMTIYKFTWTGDSCNYYFHDTDSANIVLQYDF